MSESRFIKLLSIPKSVYVSGKLCGWRNALKMPVFVRYNCVLNSLKGAVSAKCGYRSRMLSIGFSCSGIDDKIFSRAVLEIDGCIELSGCVTFCSGCKISVAKTGVLKLCDGIFSNFDTTVICVNKIEIGAYTAIGWDVMIMDTDWHSVMDTQTGDIFPASGAVVVGRNCWLGCRSIVLKNSYLPDGCILASNSTLTKRFLMKNTLLAGNPASEKKHNISKSTKGDFQFMDER